MPTVASFVSEKGGTGKTVSCYHIAIALERFHGKRVLVIDADYQRGGITGRFFPELIENFDEGHMKGTTIFHKFQQLYSASNPSWDVDIIEFTSGIDLIPSDPRLSRVTVDKLPSQNNIKENNKSMLNHMQVMTNIISNLEDNYDFVFIDSHPEISDVLRCVIYSSDYCVSPVKLDRQSSIGVATILGEINNVNADVDLIRRSLDSALSYDDTEFAGAIGMMARHYGGTLKQSEELEYNRLRRMGVFENYVTEGDGIRKAAADRIPVYDVAGTNAEKQSHQFISITQEFLSRCT